MESPKLLQPTVIGQLDIATYTLITLAFPARAAVMQADIVSALRSAAKSLVSAFPFLGGRVVQSPHDLASRTTGTFTCIPYPPHADGTGIIKVVDCTSTVASYAELSARKFPGSMLDGKILCPKKGFTYMYDATTAELPVVIIQANFITGGLLLTFACEHNMLDMNALGQMVRLFATACRGEAFPAAARMGGNPASSDVIPFLHNGEKKLAHLEMRVPSSLKAAEPQPSADLPAPPPPGPEVKWRYYRIPGAAAKQLKAEAAQSIPSDVGYISTNDAVTAFYVSCLTRARLGLRAADFEGIHEVNLLRAVNGRKRLEPQISDDAMIHMICILVTRLSNADLVQGALGQVAGQLRKALLTGVTDFYVRSLATTIRDEPDKTTFNYGAGAKSGLDVLTSSFADLGLLTTSFGTTLGKAEYARRPALDDAEALMYLMPKTEAEDYDICCCLRDGDADALEKDAAWRQIAETIG